MPIIYLPEGSSRPYLWDGWMISKDIPNAAIRIGCGTHLQLALSADSIHLALVLGGAYGSHDIGRTA